MQNLLSIVLIPLSWVYVIAVWVRNVCYDAGIFSRTRVNVPVISVGNMTTGGTGKTPLVEYLIRSLQSMKKKVAVVSRGYGRSTSGTVIVSDGKTLLGNASTAGDEPWQIARKFPDTVVIVDEQKTKAAQLAAMKYSVDIILLDDGFQHRSLQRDLDIVVVDSTKHLQSVRMLPAGHRREPMSSLKRATSLAFSRCEKSGHEHDEYIRYTNVSSFCMKPVAKKLVSYLNNQTIPLKDCAGKRCIAFAGIGNPKSFDLTLREIGLSVMEFASFPDHHSYTDSDIRRLSQMANESKPDFIITTEKDAVRLLLNHKTIIESLHPLFFLTIEQEIIRGESLMHQLLEEVFRKHAA